MPLKSQKTKTDPGNNKVCTKCPDYVGGAVNVKSDGVCDSACETNFIADIQNFCQPCKMQAGVCQVNCDAGYKADGSNVCQTCKNSGGLFNQNGLCETKCDAGYEADSSDNICKTCHEMGKFNQDGVCQTFCNKGYIFSPNNVDVSFLLQFLL